MIETDEQTLKIGEKSLTSYGLVQCTRDLDVGSCEKCLSDLMVEALNCCESKIGWRISGPSCFLRYENYSFTAGLPLLLPQPPLSQSLPAAPQPDNGNKCNLVLYFKIKIYYPIQSSVAVVRQKGVNILGKRLATINIGCNWIWFTFRTFLTVLTGISFYFNERLPRCSLTK